MKINFKKVVKTIKGIFTIVKKNSRVVSDEAEVKSTFILKIKKTKLAKLIKKIVNKIRNKIEDIKNPPGKRVKDRVYYWLDIQANMYWLNQKEKFNKKKKKKK